MRWACVVLAACGGGTDPAPPATGSLPPPRPVDAAPPAIDATPGPTLADLPKLDDVPPLVLARPGGGKLGKAVKLNAEGYKLHVAKDFAGAAAKYAAALVEDPGNVLARYNLASAAVSTGDAKRGLAILATLKLPDCRACTGILAHAKSDAEWEKLRATAAFVAITRDAQADKPDIDKLSDEVVPLLAGRGKTAELAPYFHPRQPLVLTRNGHTFEQFYTPDELRRWGARAEADHDPYIRIPSLKSCKDSCCAFSMDPKQCGAGCGSDTAFDLERICFGGYGDVWFVEKIEFFHYLSAGPG